MEKQKHIPTNPLWRMRKTHGLELKQVARLLGNNSTDNISNYEKSNSMPNLKNTIKLMLIYNSDLKEMFPELFNLCRQEIDLAFKKYSFVISLPVKEKVMENINYCTFEEMSDRPNLSENDANLIRNHITKLAKKQVQLQ
jgi:transcriptional regulator with XRE-family HTH domain